MNIEDVVCSSRDAYLADLEEVYNFGMPKRKWVGLKMEAIKAMSERNVVNKSK